MTTSLTAVHHCRALATLSAIDEALIRVQYDVFQCEVLRRESAYLAGLLYDTVFEQMSIVLRESVVNLMDIDPAKRAARSIHEALVRPAAALC